LMRKGKLSRAQVVAQGRNLMADLKDIITERAVPGMGNGISRLVILTIRFYQVTLRFLFPPSCRFHPSCSEYAIEAFRRFGPIKGGWLSVRRLSRCHPFSPGGFDPLP
jgi:putative membrane protein insertion efficiency factor